MISRDDIIGMCGLTEEEIDALAEHEHVPELAAAALGSYLLHSERGADVVAGMICDDVRAALARGDSARAAELTAALSHFLAEHAPAMR